jgi:phosphopantothenoylcysteine decarboxylase / phosphopantothenate---cysteine ligase
MFELSLGMLFLCSGVEKQGLFMSKILAGKKIVVGVTGSIAAFKVAGWVSRLAKEEARVSVIMTESAQQFVSPLTFSALSGEKTYCSMFDGDLNHAMTHIELAQEASLFIIAPATAQSIARLAHGMADDLLSATVLATRAPVIVCPAMNSKMFLHRATQDNIARLRDFGYLVVDPDSGMMACKDDGPGRLGEFESVQEVILKCLSVDDFKGQKILITAGPTQEAIDPARFISNRSSGKMGYALARSAFRRGAKVTLVSGPTALECPYGVKRIQVTSAQEMYEAVMEEAKTATIIIKSAAVSDFKPVVCHTHKIKKDQADKKIDLQSNPDILYELGQQKENNRQIIVGFAAESDNLEGEARKKLHRKNLDLIAVNDITSSNTGFAVDTNQITLIDSEHTLRLPLTSKSDTADLIMDAIANLLSSRKS